MEKLGKSDCRHDNGHEDRHENGHGYGNGKVCFCPLHGILDTISKKWALMVIAAVGNSGSSGFNELKRTLCNVSSKTLSNTLKDLEEQNLIMRSVASTAPPTVQYSLTDKGFELRELLIPLLEWVEKNGSHEEEGCPIHVKIKNVGIDKI